MNPTATNIGYFLDVCTTFQISRPLSVTLDKMEKSLPGGDPLKRKN